MPRRPRTTAANWFADCKGCNVGNLKERLVSFWSHLNSSFWFLPSLISVASIILAFFTIWLDRHVFPTLEGKVFWAFTGRSEAARSVLSTIAGASMAVISIAFSITIIAIQQAASQYSPRILRRFTSDRGNQVVLGTYIATFLFSLITLREVRSESDGISVDQFIPAFSVSVALLLSLISVGLLVYFIHHITQQIQVSTMLANIRCELEREFCRLYPDRLKDGSEESYSYEASVGTALPNEPGMPILTEAEGYIETVAIDRLMELTKGAKFVWVSRAIGDYVVKGATLATVWHPLPQPPELESDLRDCFSLGPQRGVMQDPFFAIQQIVDVAVKALSPGINDPTTAKQCLTEIKGVLAGLVGLEIPPAMSDVKGTHYLVNRPGFSDYVERCFGQIRRYAKHSFDVQHFLYVTIADISRLPMPRGRQEIIYRQLDALEFVVGESNCYPKERESLLQKIRALRRYPHAISHGAAENVA